mgnify:CR=1 FL=1
MLTCDEVAERMRVKRITVYDWIRKGKLDFVQVGKRKLIPEEALQKLIYENTRTAEGEKVVRKRGRPKKIS